ncbi:hypothetical protein AA0229_0293 [Gluconobacter cerinus NRIC 0229]|nr:hypothetical protein AA0229_0293 [Gluconobacter cerinus NRIC 0229]
MNGWRFEGFDPQADALMNGVTLTQAIQSFAVNDLGLGTERLTE